MKTKQLGHIMVIGMVTNDADVMPGFIFTHGLRFNMEVYIKGQEKSSCSESRVSLLRPYHL